MPEKKFIPHITIKRSIDRQKMQSMLDYLGKMNYEKEFLCDKLVLLKRKVEKGSKGDYEALLEAPLLPLNV